MSDTLKTAGYFLPAVFYGNINRNSNKKGSNFDEKWEFEPRNTVIIHEKVGEN